MMKDATVSSGPAGSPGTRRERDLLGERDVPDDAFFGIHTLRALENFNISGVAVAHFPAIIEAFAAIKMAAALTNAELGLLPMDISHAIVGACRKLLDGKYRDQFVVDMIQGGAGTSTNMNVNEVVANIALEILGHSKGAYPFCHPNTHVNCSQSTNDVYPSALKLALIRSNTQLIDTLVLLIKSFRSKGVAFKNCLKMGRTQLQDAVPMTLGQEFEAYAETLEEEIGRLNQNVSLFLELNIGGTAIGTGINTVSGYREKVLDHLKKICGLPVRDAANLVEATQDTGSFVMYSSALKRLAIKLSKISNDLRLLSSGPRTGLNEIILPPVQAGSSIMPGKINPVVPEAVNQIAYKVIGNDLTVTMAAEAGQLELNAMEPVIAQSLFESMHMLKRGMKILQSRCIDGIVANEKRMRDMMLNSIGLVTALVPVLSYEACSELAHEALKTDKGIYELVLDKKLLSKRQLDRLLSPENMIDIRTAQVAP